MLVLPLGQIALPVRKKGTRGAPNRVMKEKCKYTVRSKVLNLPKLCKLRMKILLPLCLWNYSFLFDQGFLIHTLFPLTVLSKATY